MCFAYTPPPPPQGLLRRSPTQYQLLLPHVLVSLLSVDFELLSSVAKLICVTLINEHPRDPTRNNRSANLSCNEDISLMTLCCQQFSYRWVTLRVVAVQMQNDESYFNTVASGVRTMNALWVM